MERNAKSVLNFDSILENILVNNKELATGLSSVEDLQKKMERNEKFYKKVQEEVFKNVSTGHDELLEQIKAEFKQEEEKFKLGQITADELEKARKKQEHELKFQKQINEDINNDVMKNLILTEKQLKLNQKVVLQMDNVKDSVEDLAAKIRNPSKIAEDTLKSMGGWAPALLKANQQGDSFKDILGNVGKKMTETFKSAKSLFGATGVLIVGVAAATAALTTMFKLFTNYWSFLDDKVIPANAEFNKQLGATSTNAEALKGQMHSTGVEFELLGKSYAEGAQLVRDLSEGLMSLDIPKDVMKTGKELTAILGLTGDEAGKLIMQFQKAGYSMKDLNEAFGQGEAAAQAYGVPVNQVLRDMRTIS